MEAQPQIGLRGDSGDGAVQSYQAPSKVQGEAGHACERRMEPQCASQGCMGGHGTDSESSSIWSMHVLHSVRQRWLPMPT